MKFYSSYNRPPSRAHEECPKEMQDYIKDETTGELVPSGKIPFYERIQSHYESSTLAAKLKRFAMGDNSALGVPSDSYGDFTGMPTDLRQILDSRQKVHQDFANLPDDIRAIFNNDFDSFESAVKDGTAERRIVEQLRAAGNGTGAAQQAPAGSGSDSGGTGQ